MDVSETGTAAPPAKRPRFTREPDLEVEVEGKTFRLHSHVLMAASDVFTTMLESQMSEGQSGYIKLPDKASKEFELLVRHLDLRGGAAAPMINEDDVAILLRWADEYQMDGLKERCREFLERHRVCNATHALKLCLEFEFTELATMISKSLAIDVFNRRKEITEFVDEPIVMKAVVRHLQRKLDMEEVAGEDSVAKQLWLIIVKMLEVEKEALGKGEQEYYFKRARALMKKLGSIIPAIRGVLGLGWFSSLKEGDYDKMVTLEQVKKKCTESCATGFRFDGGEVEAILAHLVAERKLFKSEKSGKYYRGIGREWGDSDG